MKNDYKIEDDYTIIFLRNAEGIVTGEAIIDTTDLPFIKEFPNSWRRQDIRNGSEVRGTYKIDGLKKNITLQKYLLNFPTQTIYHLDGDKLNNRRSNLSYRKPLKGNEYIRQGDVSVMILVKRNGEKIEVTIDTEDIERMSKYTWITEWHKEIKNYLINTVIYNEENNRKKISLQNYLLDNNTSQIISFKNGDRLDFRKDNLSLGDIKNQFKVIGDYTEISLIRGNGEVSKTLIDTEDLEKVRGYGFTWHYFIGNHEASSPYAVGNKVDWDTGQRKSKRIYLHRVIMDCPYDRVVDHINHDTLDNRKSNLRIVSASENQQNRKGARKGSKSGARGVSWDETNKDWIVNVKGEYILRTKDKSEAERIAMKKISELLPFSNGY
jgi:hypothetical protein